MLFSKWNMTGQNRPTLPPAGVTAAAANRQRPPAMVKTLPNDDLGVFVGFAPLEAPPFPEQSDRYQHRKTERGVERDQPARRHGVLHELQVEALVAPDEVSVENFLIGQERDRHHRDQDAQRQHAKLVLLSQISGQEPVERANHDGCRQGSDDPVRKQDSRDHQPEEDERGDPDRSGDDPPNQLLRIAVGDR
jgi:hypothetical protein